MGEQPRLKRYRKNPCGCCRWAILRASGIQNVREALQGNALSFDRLLALGISSQN